MALNDLGRIVEQEWSKSEHIRAEIQLDEWVVMPNHFHGIVLITRHGEVNDWRNGAGGLRGGAGGLRCHADDWRNRRGDRPVAPTTRRFPTGPKSKSVGALVAGFKAAATKRINKIRGMPGSPVWQRNYYEHIIRDEASLNRIRQYIIENPNRWNDDLYNPAR